MRLTLSPTSIRDGVRCVSDMSSSMFLGLWRRFKSAGGAGGAGGASSLTGFKRPRDGCETPERCAFLLCSLCVFIHEDDCWACGDSRCTLSFIAGATVRTFPFWVFLFFWLHPRKLDLK